MGRGISARASAVRRWLQRALLAGALGAVAACGGVQREAPLQIAWAPGVLTASHDDALAFHDQARTPIYLGDRRGLLGSVSDDELPDEEVPAYGWRFRLDRLPTRAYMHVRMTGVGSPNHGCATLVRVNQRTVLKLFDDADSPLGRDVTRSLSVPRDALRIGENALTVEQPECGFRARQRNDALLKVARLELRYGGAPVPASEAAERDEREEQYRTGPSKFPEHQEILEMAPGQ